MRYITISSLGPIRHRLMTGLLLSLVAAAALLIGPLARPQSTSAANVRPPAPACANGTVVTDQADHPGLVRDCEILLGLRDALAGNATLNWSVTLPITQWEGIIVDRRNGNVPLRVTALKLRDRGLDGTLPPALGGLSGPQVLWLSLNQLTGSIPPELGNMTTLTELRLAGNQLSGSIPVELAEIGPQLERLDLSGSQPLPSGIGLTGRIPPQLGNLSGLQSLHLEGNRLSGPIPIRLGQLTNLQGLHLHRNQLSGVIPTQLGALTMLDELRLADNQLVSAIPTQLINLQLQRLYLTGNTITGCLPYWLGPGFLQYGDLARLNLPDCVGTEPSTPETPLPTYTLTVTAGAGGSVSPAGATSYDEAVEIVLTASWNDATHTFAGWSGDCSGSATTCALEMYADHSVTATFTELPATRCAAPEDADCIRAAYVGAPDDYAQVQDIPAEFLLTPNADGRYEVERGQQVTVVTAAPLPPNHDRFVADIRPDSAPSPTSFLQLVPPVGTTYSLTASGDAYAADRIEFDLRAAIARLGSAKPIPGAVVVTTGFEVLPDPLTLEFASSSELCTANALAELSWTISGGKAPYTLTIDGETVNARSESHDVNCGPLEIEPLTSEPLIDQFKTFQALVTDEHGVSASAEATVEVLGPGAPTLSARTAASGSVALSWSAESTTGVTHWEYRQRQGDAAWGVWTRIAGSDAATTEHSVSGLTEDARYSFHLRPVCGNVAGPRSATASAAAGLTPEPMVDLLYGDYDATGGAIARSAYALLSDATDLSSGITNLEDAPTAVALLVNTEGFGGRHYADFLNDVAVGDAVTWFHNHWCWYAYEVVALHGDPPAPARKLFSIRLTEKDTCKGPIRDTRGGHFDRLVWGPPPSEPVIGTDGIRIFPRRHPVEGGHTYRITADGGYWIGFIVVDVPANMRLIQTGSSEEFGGTITVSLMDEASGALLGIDFDTGEEVGRYFPEDYGSNGDTRDVGALFDAIAASARVQHQP